MNFTGTMLLTFATFIAVGAVVLTEGAAANAQATTRMINVNGKGTIREKPNIVRITLGSQVTASDPLKASSLCADELESITKALQALGIADKDIQTSGYSIAPQYRTSSTGSESLTGYQASNNVVVTIRDVSKAGPVFDAGVKAGANVAGGLEFDIDEVTALRDRDMALKKAVEDGYSQAVLIAKASKAGAIFLDSISETGEGREMERAETRAMGGRGSASEAVTTIAPGEITIVVTVSSSYHFDPQRIPNY